MEYYCYQQVVRGQPLSGQYFTPMECRKYGVLCSDMTSICSKCPILQFLQFLLAQLCFNVKLTPGMGS